MSLNIWTQCAAKSEIKPLEIAAWRVVEAQHVVSTRKLVQSDAEQHILEELIERSKPPVEETFLHYLLFTPFRYPPLRHGSRFGSRFERGIWYGSESARVALAETAYYRLVFLEGTEAKIEPVLVDLTVFAANIFTKYGLNLTTSAWASVEAVLTSKTNYGPTQDLGKNMRENGVQAFIFQSARDPHRGNNVGVFEPVAFKSKKPSHLQTWLCVATRRNVEFTKRDFFQKNTHRFEREIFEVDGNLPCPAA